MGLAVPRLSSPRGSREASKRTSDKKLTDRSGKLLSTRLGEAGRSAHRRNGLEGFFPKKNLTLKIDGTLHEKFDDGNDGKKSSTRRKADRSIVAAKNCAQFHLGCTSQCTFRLSVAEALFHFTLVFSLLH